MALIHVFLIRHAEAEDGGFLPDAHRGLTARGRQRLRKSVRLLAEQRDEIDAIYTSPLVRAVQTAEIVASGLGLDDGIHARGVIAAPPTLDALSALLTSHPRPVKGLALVGHEPTLSEYADHLLAPIELNQPFKKGMIVALALDPRTRQAQFRFAILPKGPEIIEAL